jgi:hypothetical protein
MVQFYDPTDLFGDLAEALADTYPGIAPDDDDEDEDEDGGAAEEATAETIDDVDVAADGTDDDGTRPTDRGSSPA